MRGIVLSRSPLLYSTARVVLSARARGHEVMVSDPVECRVVVRDGGPQILHRKGPLAPVDFVIPRIGASITTYGLALVRQFELLGTAVINDSTGIAQSRDKLRALQMLATKGLSIPATVCVRTPDHLAGVLKTVGGVPAIVKLQQGAQGIGTMIAETEQAVTSLVETFWAMGQEIVVQEYIREAKGRDVRAIVIGGKVVAAMTRHARPGEFRSNLHRGGRATRTQLTDELEDAAVRAACVLGLDVAGVDMLVSKSGPKILEVNSSPGLEGIERVTGVDVAAEIVRCAERLATRWRRRVRAADIDPLGNRSKSVSRPAKANPGVRRK